MPNAIYQYVYYEPIEVGGPETRQNRNPATSSKYLSVPDITVPSTNDLAPGSNFTPDVPPQSYTDAGGNVYTFGFMNVSGCVGAGETSTDYSNLPGSASFAPLLVGSDVINILVLYINNGAPGPGGGSPSIYLDAFDETTGTFLDNFFVTGIAPDNGLTSNVNVYGSLAPEPVNETVAASANPINTPGVADSDANFDKWVKLEGPSGNPVISGNSLNLAVGASTPSNITAFAFYKEPASVYITGGYQSPDILLFTPFSTTSMGTPVPIGSSVTNVTPGVQYGFAAVVHNDSAYAVSTQVTFWNIPGGAGVPGAFMDTQSVVIGAGSSAMVFSSLPFVNAGGHTCAVVSLDTPDSPCQFAPTDSAESVNIPSPIANVAHSCSAWRNTETMIVFPGLPWHFGVGLGNLHELYGAEPIGLQVNTHFVAAEFAQNDRVLKIVREHSRIYSKTPPYLIPVLRNELPTADLGIAVTLASKGSIDEDKAAASFKLNFENRNETSFNVAGKTPANAKPGDTYLVQVSAHYPAVGRLKAKTIEFLEILVVQDK